jgi:dynein heavy chain
VGPTGTSKTITVIDEINENYNNPKFANLITAFSGKTSSYQIQKQMESKMCTKRRK